MTNSFENFQDVTNLCFETKEVTLDNFLEIIMEAVETTFSHLAMHNFGKVIFIETSMIPEEPDFFRVGVVFVTMQDENPQEVESKYRLVSLKTRDIKICEIIQTHLSHTTAVACAEATQIVWNAIAPRNSIIVVAPSLAIKRMGLN